MRKEKRRRLVRPAVIALAILYCFTFLWTACGRTAGDVPERGMVLYASATATPMPSTQPTEAPTESPEQLAPEPMRASILLTGDLMCLSAQIGAAGNGNGYDFTPSFAAVKDIFDRADLVAGNLETCVAEGFSYAGPVEYLPAAEGEEPKRKAPELNAPPAYLDALAGAGVDFVSTAGNHCCDMGAEGIERTIGALDAVGIGHTGTFASADAERFSLMDINGISVAFLAYTEYFNGKDGLLGEEQRSYMVNRWSEERAQADIAQARAAGAEFVIVYIHWGNENEKAVSGTQREHAQFLAETGADVIAGAHPHVLQAAEYIPTEDGRQVLCFYSLGNFVSSMADQAHNDTIIAEITLEKGDGDVLLDRAVYTPCRVGTVGNNPFVVQEVGAEGDAARRIAEAVGPALSIKEEAEYVQNGQVSSDNEP